MIQNDLLVQSAALLQRLNGLGFDCVAEDDFETILERVHETGKTAQSPMFSLQRNDFTKGEAFWVFLMQDAQRRGALAARFYDLKGETLEAYLRRTSSAQYGQGAPVIDSMAPALSRFLRGKMIYFGELQLARETRGNRHVLTAFSRLSMILAAMSWPEFDWMYAFIPKEHARLADAYGFTYRLPRAIRWVSPAPPGRLDSHMLIAISVADFAHLLATGELSEF